MEKKELIYWDSCAIRRQVDSYQGWNQLPFGAFGGISRANSQIKRTILRAVKRPCQLTQLEELRPTSLLIVSADEKEVGL